MPDTDYSAVAPDEKLPLLPPGQPMGPVDYPPVAPPQVAAQPGPVYTPAGPQARPTPYGGVTQGERPVMGDVKPLSLSRRILGTLATGAAAFGSPAQGEATAQRVFGQPERELKEKQTEYDVGQEQAEKAQTTAADVDAKGAQTESEKALAKQRSENADIVYHPDPRNPGQFIPILRSTAEKMDAQAAKDAAAGQRTDTTVQGRESVAAGQNASKEKIAAQNNKTKMEEYRDTDDYRRWKEKLDNDTKLKIGEMTASKAPAAIMTTAVYANGGLSMMSDAERAMADLKARGVMGSIPANKVEDWLFGAGLVDPTLDADTKRDIGKLRAALGYTSSATMRAHTGRTSKEIYEDFKSRLGPGQDWDALQGALEETHTLLSDYSAAASDASIAAMRAGNQPSGAGAPPPGARIRTYNPATGKVE